MSADVSKCHVLREIQCPKPIATQVAYLLLGEQTFAHGTFTQGTLPVRVLWSCATD
jgi:hypothetical protein